MSAPTGPEPEERVGMCGDLAPLIGFGGVSAPSVLCDLRAAHAGWHEGGEHRTSWTHGPTDLAAQVSALQADVARLEGERDSWRRVSERLEGERLDAAVERDRWRFTSEGWENTANEWLARVEKTEAERDEARTAWAGAVTRLEDVALALGDWRDFQMGARTARSEPQSDAEGSGMAQDVQEALGAQKGVRGASEAAYEAAARAYVDGIESRYGWSAGKVEYWANEKVFRAAVDAVRPLFIAEGRRQAVAAIRARVGDIAATEWAALIVEEEGR